MKRDKELAILEEEVLANPNIVSTTTLVEKYVAVGNIDKALEIAKLALDNFPDSDKVFTTYQNVKRMKFTSQIVELHRNLKSNPTKTYYEQLAYLYYTELDDKNRAFEICLKGLEKFPNSDGLHLLCGQIRMDRFHQDFLANDCKEALRHFEKSVELNPLNYKAMLFLGRLYSEIGHHDRTSKIFLKILEFDTENELVEKLLELIKNKGVQETPNLDDTLEDIENRKRLSEIGNEVIKLFEPISKTTTVILETPITSEEALHILEGLQTISGLEAASIITRQGKVIVDYSRGSTSKEQFSKAIYNIYKTAEESSGRMDIGSFLNGEIEISNGRIYIRESRSFILGALFALSSKKNEIYQKLEEHLNPVTPYQPR